MMAMSDYERIAQTILYIEKHFKEQPDLEAMAAATGLSSSHFHRIFRRWAGTTPKHFLQNLCAIEARKLLHRGDSVLDTSYELGLSGPGRLHDLCVKMEAASPGEISSGGRGWTIQAGLAATPFGDALIATAPRGICYLAFVGNDDEREVEWEKLQVLWPNSLLKRDDVLAHEQSRRIFALDENSREKPLPLFVKGTRFQLLVWRALIQRPDERPFTYSELAGEIGSPKAQRAVGTAIGKNSLAYLIPCHRVIRASGATGNYRWGRPRKKAILAWEASRNSLEDGD